MQYSYERWANEAPEVTEPPETSASASVPASAPEEQTSQFSEDLKALEDTLSLGLDEGLETFRQYQQSEAHEHLESHESDWDELARLVADHVLAYMLDNPVQAELTRYRAKVDEYYQDNRNMAKHVQQLVEENEQLRISVSACELELARFRNLAGSLYFRV